jgi:glycosyltransferase involved in cell wall biosynthesis
MAKNARRVMLVGQTPPPVDGQTVMIQELVNGRYNGVVVYHIRTELSRTTSEVGVFHLRKPVMVLKALLDMLVGRWRSRAEILYYLPAGPMLYPVLRDIFLLVSTRWLFRYTVFHFQAAGLPEIYPRLPWWLKPLFNLAYRNADVAIFLTPSTAPAGADLQAKVVTVIPNCIPDQGQDSLVESRRNGGVPRILFMGVLCEGKGVLTLIEACSLLQKAGLGFRLVCAGAFTSETFKREVMKLIEDRGLAEVINFPGVLTGETKSRAFREADMFCFPSHYYAESFGIVLIEAMSFGLPIVTTRWRGIPDVVGGSGGAFIVEPKRPDLVAAELEKLFRDSELRVVMGRKNREWFCDHYTIEIFRSGIEKVLQEVGVRTQPGLSSRADTKAQPILNHLRPD